MDTKDNMRYINNNFIVNVSEHLVAVASIEDGKIITFGKEKIEDLVEAMIAVSADIKLKVKEDKYV